LGSASVGVGVDGQQKQRKPNSSRRGSCCSAVLCVVCCAAAAIKWGTARPPGRRDHRWMASL